MKQLSDYNLHLTTLYDTESVSNMSLDDLILTQDFHIIKSSLTNLYYDYKRHYSKVVADFKILSEVKKLYNVSAVTFESALEEIRMKIGSLKERDSLLLQIREDLHSMLPHTRKAALRMVKNVLKRFSKFPTSDLISFMQIEINLYAKDIDADFTYVRRFSGALEKLLPFQSSLLSNLVSFYDKALYTRILGRDDMSSIYALYKKRLTDLMCRCTRVSGWKGNSFHLRYLSPTCAVLTSHDSRFSSTLRVPCTNICLWTDADEYTDALEESSL